MPYRKTNRRKTYRKKPGATTRRKGMNRQKFKFTKGLSRSDSNSSYTYIYIAKGS